VATMTEHIPLAKKIQIQIPMDVYKYRAACTCGWELIADYPGSAEGRTSAMIRARRHTSDKTESTGPLPRNLRNTTHWPIEVHDAPIRCGLCHEVIVGSGIGTIPILRNLIEVHRIDCKGEMDD
jgi:hypothetical protein